MPMPSRITRICQVLLAPLLAWLSASPAHAAPAVATPAPAFRQQDQNGKWHAMAAYRGIWQLLYFYPKDATPGCTTEACSFRDNLSAFTDAGAVVLGVSVDDVDSHGKFAKEHSLPFPLLADADKKTTE